MSRLTGWPVALVLVLGLLGGCGGPPSENGENADGEDKPEEPSIPVEVAVAELGAISAAWRGSATLEAEAESDVVARVGGIVETLHVEEGDPVQAGDPLAQLDTDQRALELRQSKAELERLRADHERNKAIFRENLISREIFDRTRFELESAQAAYDMAKLALEYSTIRSPITGTVSERYIKVGNLVAANAPAFHVTQFDPLLAVFHVPEREIHKLGTEQVAKLTFDAWPDETFAGRVDRISPVVNPDTGTVKVTVKMDDAGTKLQPGMFGRVRILYDSRDDAVLVPADAVVTEDARDAVFVIADGKAQRREVEVGFSEGDVVQIVSGVETGETVVITGQAALRDGSPVDVIGEDDDGAEDATEPDAEADEAAADQG